MNVINLTPHAVRLVREDGTEKSYPPSGEVARVIVQDRVAGELDDAPILYGEVRNVTGVPEKKEDTVYIVSHFVLQNSQRQDLIAPDTNDAVRDDAGKILGVRGWRKIMKRNTGDFNTGDFNTGNKNAGSYNSGHSNVGNNNAGSYNSGSRNTGHFNAGNVNTGDHNTGDKNTGNHNTGDKNTGDFNISDHATGCFNTETPKLKFFDKETDMTWEEWGDSDAYWILWRVNFNPVTWIKAEHMNDKEKDLNPDYKTSGGFLRTNNPTDVFNNWWKLLTSKERSIIADLPNFDPQKFEQITGIEL